MGAVNGTVAPGVVSETTTGGGTGPTSVTGTTPIKATPTTGAVVVSWSPTANVPMGTHKFTGLANGSAATDSAAFGQIPTSLPPNGTAGGGLAGSYPTPTVAKVPSGALTAGTNVTLTTSAGKAVVSTTTVAGVAHNTGATLALTDAGKMVTVTNAAAKTITIPKNATVAFPTGTVIYVSQTGAGQVTIAAAATVTLHAFTNKLHTGGQYAVGMLRKMATNTWRWFGQIA